MFMGEYRHAIDEKGRLIIPSKFREDLGEVFVITRGMDGCLFGYPENEWAVLQEKLQKLPLTKKDARAFVRFFYSAATECEFDKQGRVSIPKSLRDHALLEKSVSWLEFQIDLKYGLKSDGMISRKLLKVILMK